MTKAYNRVNWADYPSTSTKVNAANLNKMDKGIDDIDDRVVTLDSTVSAQASTIGGHTNQIGALGGQLTANSNSIYMDYQDGKYGINTSAERGADTFIPFKSALVAHKVTFSGSMYSASGSWHYDFNVPYNSSDYDVIVQLGLLQGGGSGGGVMYNYSGTTVSIIAYSGSGNNINGYALFLPKGEYVIE